MIHVIIGAPCSGKSTFAQKNAKDGDVIIDYDRIAKALGSAKSHRPDGAVKKCAFAARTGAIEKALTECTGDVDAWIIHTSPTKEQMEMYEEVNAEFHVMKATREECLERSESDARPEGTIDAINAYFDSNDKKSVERKQKDCSKSDASVSGGYVIGYASTFDRTPDSYGDVVAKGAFSKTLKDWEAKYQKGIYIPLLFGHRTDDPKYNIGKIVKAEEDERGLLITAEFADTQKAQEVRELVKDGRLYQFSFAYAVIDECQVTLEDGTKANELRELELYEVSLVQIPANQNATVEEIKSISEKAGRRNSKADESDLERIKESALEIVSVINGLLSVDDIEESEEEAEQVNEESEEPKAAETLESKKVSIYKEAIKNMAERH